MTITPDKSALAQARERLELDYESRAEALRHLAGTMSNEPGYIKAKRYASDLRLVLDALKEAERVADAGKRLADGRYRHWELAGGPKESECAHGIDKERFACIRCDELSLTNWRNSQ